MDIEVTRAEAQLDRLIEGRAAAVQAENERARMWAESVRKYNLSRRADRSAAWAEYHREQAARHRATLEDLIARHEAAAASLLETAGGEGVS